MQPIKLKADTLAKRLGVTNAERTALRFSTIGAADLTRADRAKAKRKRKTDAERDRRRRKGAVPRAQYLANALSRTRPWETEGISRSTWERRRRGAVTQVRGDRKCFNGGHTLASPKQAARPQACHGFVAAFLLALSPDMASRASPLRASIGLGASP
jgi:hypothetical protein